MKGGNEAATTLFPETMACDITGLMHNEMYEKGKLTDRSFPTRRTGPVMQASYVVADLDTQGR